MVTNKRPRSRNAAQTREKILDSVGRILAHRGFSRLGIRAIAREAKVDKVLIYRYFGGLPELLTAFAERSDFFPGLDETLGADEAERRSLNAAEYSARALSGTARALRARPLTQAVMRWELAESNALTRRLGDVRERRGLEVLAALPREGLSRDLDLAAVGGVLSAGLIYLVLRSKGADEWMGVPIRTEEGWARLERAAELLVRTVVAEGGKARGPRSSTKGGP
jgi:AcrR family transcriptional regulator